MVKLTKSNQCRDGEMLKSNKNIERLKSKEKCTNRSPLSKKKYEVVK